MYRIILIFVFLFSLNLFADIGEPGDQQLAINTYVEVNAGNVIKGSSKKEYWDDQVITFEIFSADSKSIKITKVQDAETSDLIVEAQWKAGPYTGFEQDFENGTFTPVNEKFYVTVTIKSIKAKISADNGIHTLSPSIMVEQLDL